VRHKAGEALGAVGCADSLEVLEKFSTKKLEVVETCQLAVQRIKWLLGEQKETVIDASYKENPYCSVDPTPAIKEKDATELREILLNETLPSSTDTEPCLLCVTKAMTLVSQLWLMDASKSERDTLEFVQSVLG